MATSSSSTPDCYGSGLVDSILCNSVKVGTWLKFYNNLFFIFLSTKCYAIYLFVSVLSCTYSLSNNRLCLRLNLLYFNYNSDNQWRSAHILFTVLCSCRSRSTSSVLRLMAEINNIHCTIFEWFIFCNNMCWQSLQS